MNKKHSSANLVKKGIILLLYGLGIAVIIICKEPMLLWLSDGRGKEHLLWMIGAATLLATLPVVPFGVIAGIIGTQFGPGWGAVINVFSSTLAAILLFLAARIP